MEEQRTQKKCRINTKVFGRKTYTKRRECHKHVDKREKYTQNEENVIWKRRYMGGKRGNADINLSTTITTRNKDL